MKREIILNPKFDEHIEMLLPNMAASITVKNPFDFNHPDGVVIRTPRKTKDGLIEVTIKKCKMIISHIEVVTDTTDNFTFRIFWPSC